MPATTLFFKENCQNNIVNQNGVFEYAFGRDGMERRLLCGAIVLLCILLVGCEEVELPYSGYGYVRNFDRSSVDGLQLILGSSSFVTTDENGRWNATLQGIVDITPVPDNKHVVIYPTKRTVNSNNRRADFIRVDFSKREEPFSAHQSFLLANSLGYPTGLDGIYSDKINRERLDQFTSSTIAYRERVDQDYLDEIRSLHERTRYSGFKIGSDYAVVRPRTYSDSLDIKTHAIMIKERNEWRVLIPGFLFIGEFELEKTVADVMEWLDRWESADGELREWVEHLLFAEFFDRIFANTIGTKTSDGWLLEGQRFRFREALWNDEVFELNVNEDLVSVEKAYRGKLTIGAPAQFKKNAARYIWRIFELSDNVKEVVIKVFVPTYIDDFGNTLERLVGYIKMDRSTYEKINWDTIRTEMITEHFVSEWWY